MTSNGYKLNFNELEVAVVENVPTNLRGMTYCLEGLGCNVVWTAKDDQEAKAAALEKLPDVVFVDLRLLRSSDDYEPGWQLIQFLRQRGVGQASSVIICSGTPVVDEIVLEAIRLGCSYVVKEDLWDHEDEVIAAALLAARSGSVLISNEVAAGMETLVNSVVDANPLSDKEFEVLTHVAEGLSNREVARKLFVAETTIKTHVSNILSKLSVKNRTQAAEWYHQRFS